MDTNIADEALKNAKELLARDGLTWITESSLHLRAFYWGVHCGLGKAATEADRNRISLEIVAETMFARRGDDSFKRTKIGVHFDRIREELERHIARDRQIRDVRAINERRRMIAGQSTEPEIEEPPALPIGDVSTLLSPLLEFVQRLTNRWRGELSRVQEQLGIVVGNATPEEILQTLDHL